jgi:hypothetical protein
MISKSSVSLNLLTTAIDFNLTLILHKLCQSFITRTDTIKDLGVFTNSNFQFHNHVDYIFALCIKLLGLVRTLPFSFSSLDCLYMLKFILVRSKLEYASVVWNSIMTTDANKLELIQQKFATLCYNRFLPHVHYSYAEALVYLELHTLCKRRYHLHAPYPSLPWVEVLPFPFGSCRSSSPNSVSERLVYVQFQPFN